MTPVSRQANAVNSTERFVNILSIIVGMLMCATLESSISATLTALKMQMKDYDDKMATLRRLLREAPARPTSRW